jgi:hypothetical protein
MVSKPGSRVGSGSDPIFSGGAILDDGSVLEVVRAASDSRVQLLHWNKTSSSVSASFELAGGVYRPMELDSTILHALTLPSQAADYGSEIDLVDGICESLRHYHNLSAKSSLLLAAFCLSTWLSDCLPLAPSISIASLQTADAISLLRHMRVFCRHALLLGELPSAALRAAIRGWPVTFLVHQAEVTPVTEQYLNLASHQDVLISRGHTVVEAFSPMAIASLFHAPIERAIKISLPPRNGRELHLEGGLQREIADEFQAKLLMFRLLNYEAVRRSIFDVPEFGSATRDVARTLGMCITDVSLQQKIRESLIQQDERARCERTLDIRSIVAEALLFYCHGPHKEFVVIKDLTDTANFILRERNEKRELNSKAVGAVLDALGLPARTRRATGYQLLLDEGTRRVIHRLSRDLTVRSIEDGVELCRHCSGDADDVLAA